MEKWTVNRRSLVNAGIYLILGLLWIYFSDRLLLTAFADDIGLLVLYQTYKGWLFIILTAILFFLLSRHALIKQAELTGKLTLSEQRYQQMVNTVAIGIYHMNKKGKLTYMNPSVGTITGLTHEELLRDGWSGTVHEDDRDNVLRKWREALKNRTFSYEQYRLLRNDGVEVWVVDVAYPEVDDHGGTAGYIGTLTDITRLKQTEAAVTRTEAEIREKEALYATLLDQNWNSVALLDADGRMIREFSGNFARMMGYSHEQVSTLTMEGYIHPDDIQSVIDSVTEVKAEPYKTVRNLGRVRDRHGNYHWLDYTLTNMLDDPLIGAIVGNGRDITEEVNRAEAVRQNEVYFRSLFEQSTDGIFIINLDYEITDVNEAGCRLLGCGREELVGRQINDLLPEYEWPRLQPRVDAVWEGQFHYEEWNIRRRDGTIFTAEVTAKKLADAQLLATVRDISDRKDALRNQEELGERLQLAAKSGNVGLWDWDLQTNKVNYSREWKSQIGYEEAEISDDYEEWRSRVHPDDLGPVLKKIDTCLEDPAEVYSTEFRFLHKDGSYRWILAQGEIERDANGKPLSMLGTHVDITDRKIREAALLESERRYADLYQNAPDMYLSVDVASARVINCNQTFLTATGFERDDIIGREVFQIYDPACRAAARQAFQTYRQTGLLHDVELVVRCRDGRRIDVSVNVTTYRDPDNRIIRSRSILRDISERKRAAAALQLKEHQLRLFVEYSPAAIAMFDNELRYLVYSRRWLTDYRLGDQVLTGRSHYKVFPEIPERWKAIHRRCLKGAVEKCEEDPFLRADGSTDWVRWEIHPWYTLSGEIGGIIMFTEVITERKLLQEQERTLQERLQVAVNSGNVGLWDWNLKTNKVHYSPEWKRQLGFETDEISDSLAEWQNRVHPDDVERVQLKIQAFLKDPQQRMTNEFRMHHKDGSYRWILAEAGIQFDSRGQPESMLGSHIDITQLKADAEHLRESQQMLAEAQGIAHIGSFKHDLATGHITLSDELYKIYGVARDAFVPEVESVMRLVHPEDRPDFQAWIKASLAGERPGVHDCRIIRPDGQVRYLTGIGELQYDMDNNPSCFTGTVQDITALRETQLAEATSRLRMEHLLSATPAVLYSLRVNGTAFTPVFISDSITRVLGYSVAEAMQPDWWPDHLHPEDRERCRIAMEHMLKKDHLELEYRLLHKQGYAVYIHDELRMLRNNQGMVTEITGVWSDITSQHDEQQRIRIYAAAFEHTAEGVIITSLNGDILSVNRAFQETTGYTEEELLGRNPRILKSGKHDRMFYQIMWTQLNRYGQWQGELWNRRKNGELYPAWLNISMVRDDNGSPSHYVAVSTDIAKLKQTELQLEHLAHYDPLTDLPNRLLLQSRLEHAVQQAARRNRMLGLLYIDLDDFKKINDSLGHNTGDQLLVAVSERWAARLREEDTLGRIGGDEFLLLLENISSADEVGTVARDLLSSLAEPVKLPDGHEIHTDASIGISIFPNDGQLPDVLLKNADTAMYRSKEKGYNQISFYTNDMGVLAFERLELEMALRQAVERKELILYYQPKVDLASGRMTGCEALIRWNRAGAGLIPPLKFIPIAEKTGLILTIGEWIIHEACRQARAWQDQGYDTPSIALNISVHQFHRQDLNGIILQALEQQNLEARLLGLEITESALMGDPEQVIGTLSSIKATGITISLDDFGTGYSNLSYLTRFPIDILKIDASFVRGLGTDRNAPKLVKSLIELTHNIDMRTVAEGVETQEQLTYLKEHGCDEIQGYYFSKPLPAVEFEALLREGRSIILT